MEFCSDGELFDYIVKNKRLSEDECCYFFYQIVNGIEIIHKKGYAHRDIKPENLLLAGNKILKIIDFGLSNSFRHKLLETPCGSPSYASPEMVAGNYYDGFKVDIWAMGCVLFAMACGFLPFEDNNNDILFAKIMQGSITYPPFIPPIIQDLINRILVVEASDRISITDMKRHKVYLRGRHVYYKQHEPNRLTISHNYERFNTYLQEPAYSKQPNVIESYKKTENDRYSARNSNNYLKEYIKNKNILTSRDKLKISLYSSTEKVLYKKFNEDSLSYRKTNNLVLSHRFKPSINKYIKIEDKSIIPDKPIMAFSTKNSTKKAIVLDKLSNKFKFDNNSRLRFKEKLKSIINI
jgi:serine/threonine protein kinase